MNRFGVWVPAAMMLVLAALLGLAWDDLPPWTRAVGLMGLVGAALFERIAHRPSHVAEESSTISPEFPVGQLLEKVVAAETRRPWNPAMLPWFSRHGEKPILLVPAADYHLAELVPLARELERRGLPTVFAIGDSPWQRTLEGLAWYDLDVYRLPPPEVVTSEVRAVVTMKDTGSMTDWVTECRKMGVIVIGKVEGAQDFWDADTPEERRPYRNLDLVLCQGQFDADALADQKTAIVGSTRLERLWWSPPAQATEPLALINLNFVYGVRTADRNLWLDTAVAGCEEAGIPFVISVHPAEKARPRRLPMTSVSASRILSHSTVLISRFSTLPFEAMARGVPFVYHNPHGEKVRTFQDDVDALTVTDGPSQLATTLTGLESPGDADRRRIESFFLKWIDVDPRDTSEMRGAEALTTLIV